MALSDNEVRRFANGAGEFFQELDVKASSVIFEGSAVGDDGAGAARALVAADPFRGFAYRKADNAAGAVGDERVRVRTRGEVELVVAGVTGIDDIGDTVYASDDGTFTKTAGGNTAIGKITQIKSGTTVVVYFEAGQVQSL